jgi:DNA repair and recombination protein RAD54B
LSSIPTKKRIVLTGTPIQNDLTEFYALIEFCNPGILGSQATFRNVYEQPIAQSYQSNATQEEVTIGKQRLQELMKLSNLFYLRRTQEINNKYLPNKS